MPVTQVDHAEGGEVRSVWAEVPSGPRKGRWRLERVERIGDHCDCEATGFDPDGDGWVLTHYDDGRDDYGLPTILNDLGGWVLPGAQRYGAAFEDVLGIRLVRAMFRKFGITEEPEELRFTRRASSAPLANSDVGFDRWILSYGPPDWPTYIELFDGSFVKLEAATRDQLREAAKLHDEIGKAHVELARKLRKVSRGEVRLVREAS